MTRSLLFTPATRMDRYQAALVAGKGDIVVADLEDATPAQQRPQARRALAEALAGQRKAMAAVRVNAWPSADCKADLDAVAPLGLDLIVVPKVESRRALEELQAYLAKRGNTTPVIAIIETAKGVLAAPEIASHPGLFGVAFGAEDLAAAAGMRRSASNAEVAVPRSLVALAAAAAGIKAYDMVVTDLDDTARFALEANEARALGYHGKMCIHPTQAARLAAAFAPTREEVAWAKRVLAQAASARDGGVVVVDGRMVDPPLVRQAEAILAEDGRGHKS